MALRVGINATPVLAPLTGIGNYVVRLGAALAALGDADLHSFYGWRWRHEAPAAPDSNAVAARVDAATPRLRDRVRPLVPWLREMRQAQQRLGFARGLRRHAIGIYHEPNYVPICYDVPVVVTIHDLSWLRYPETHPRDRIRWLERGMPRAVEHAAAIIVDSEFVRQEVVTSLGVDPGRVHAVHLGVAPEFHPRGAALTRAVLERLDLVHGEYLLSVGTIEPRKNVSHVLAAYARLPEKLRERHPLVIAGARGWRATDLERDLHSLALRGRIRFLGHVPDADLPALYAGAAAFVFASRYEGFGLPPLEAMACGIPVLVSNRASLPEIAGGAAGMLDPEQPGETARAIEALLVDPVARAALARRGVARASVFTWETCARATLDVYRSIT